MHACQNKVKSRRAPLNQTADVFAHLKNNVCWRRPVIKLIFQTGAHNMFLAKEFQLSISLAAKI